MTPSDRTAAMDEDEVVVLADEHPMGDAAPKQPAPAPAATAADHEGWQQESTDFSALRGPRRSVSATTATGDAGANRSAGATSHRFQERTFTGFSGLEHIDKLRARRGLLLILLFLGCTAVLAEAIAIPLVLAQAPVEVRPSVRAIRDDLTTALNPDQARLFCERLIARKETWAAWNQEYTRKVILPYFGPEIRGGIDEAMRKEAGDVKRNPKRRVGFIVGSAFLGTRQNAIYSVMVAYEIAVGIDKTERGVEILPTFQRVAELDVVRSDPTEENPEGMTVIRIREYGEEEYRRLGGRDVWSEFRALGRGAKKP